MGLEVELEKEKCQGFWHKQLGEGSIIYWDEENRDKQTGGRKNNQDLFKYITSEMFIRHPCGDQVRQLGT